MKNLIIIVSLFSSSFSWACMNSIPKSEAEKAIALVPGAGSKSCKDLPYEDCLCFDGIEWDTAKIEDGALVVDAEKKAAKDAKIAAAAAEAEKRRLVRLARKARIEAAAPESATTIAALKAIVKDLVEEARDK